MNRTSPTQPGAYPDWNLLATWVAVVEAGSVSGAACRLDISQAAVSQRLKQLEAAVGADLLDRSTRPARPTPAGQWLLEHAVRLLAQAGEMVEGLRTFSRARRRVVRFGCVDSYAGTLGPALIRGLSGESRQILLWSGLTPLLDEQLESRRIDLAVTTRPSAGRPSIKKQKLFSEPYLLVLPAQFELGAIGTLTELAKHLQFIRYSARSVIGADVDQWIERAGESIERTFEFDNTDPMLSLVAANLGFALSTPLCIWQSRHFLAQVQVLPLSALARTHAKWQSTPGRAFYLAYREGELGGLPAEARKVLDLAAGKLFSTDIMQALRMPSATLWQPAGRKG